MRSNSWSGVDQKFAESRKNLVAAKVDYGAEVVFSFCEEDHQFAEITKTVPRDSAALPMALTLVIPVNDQGKITAGNGKQAKCYPGQEQAKKTILALADKLAKYYGKLPILHGNVYNLNALTDDRFNKYMLWLAAYGRSKTPTISAPARYDTPSSWSILQLKGGNPWTLWQYTSQRQVTGIGESTAEVFFGTHEDYRNFKNGTSNAARAVALQMSVK